MFDREYESIPTILGDLEPGPELGGILACIDVDRVSPYDRVVVLQAHQRQASHHDAERYRAMTSIVDAMGIDDPRWAAETASAEIQCALNLTRRASDRELSFALELRQRHPQVWDALAGGDIDVWRAKMIADRTAHLSHAAAQQVVERVIAAAEDLTTGQLKARLDRLCIEADPQDAKDRYEYAVDGRRVVTEPTTDGTANLLGLNLSPHRVTAISRRINHLARSLKTGGESRTMDQLRADVFLDLLAGKADGSEAAAGGVHIQTDLDTLTAMAEHPGELAGYGPVIADIARQVAGELEDAEWRFSVTDTATGQPIATGTTKRRPSAGLRRDIEGRNPTCIFPGCRMPSVDCDLDHQKRWADGGTTTNRNLHPLCRHNHRIKDEAGWTYRRLANGNYQWTSRLGHIYTTSGTPP
jgi:hypothetical protein